MNEYHISFAYNLVGWGTDEKAIINVLAHQNATQRQQIMTAYNDIYHEDLVKRLESELSGDFGKAVYCWILDPTDSQAVLAHVAIKKSEPDYHVIVEIACVLSPEELLAVRRAYHHRYKRSSEEDEAAATSGDILLIMVNLQLLWALVSSFRYDGIEVNASLADKEAEILHNAIKDKALNHEEAIRILTTRSKLELIATFNSYSDD
ncbi:Annexin domain-containing protein [Cephalotus follicularis]|uniref:Annexin domain-containing protein n=1 Tax=Cephalotus follicularis TaxID=3775 RepID=A0A1Q3BSN0_CEPFO|nr:Annexin domain-containing protein [Cephalotus follicularis]